MRLLKFEIVVENPRAIEFLVESIKRMLIERDIIRLEIKEIREGGVDGE